jgi:hypothetical protein
MKEVMKSALFMMIGAGGTLAYQKYNKDVMCAMKKAVQNTMDAANNKLDEMM